VVKLSNGEYEVHNIGVSWPHPIFVDKSFKVVGANQAMVLVLRAALGSWRTGMARRHTPPDAVAVELPRAG
jgi:hypothetical protein